MAARVCQKYWFTLIVNLGLCDYESSGTTLGKSSICKIYDYTSLLLLLLRASSAQAKGPFVTLEQNGLFLSL